MTSAKTESLVEVYPVAIIQDRYGGTYSQGTWIAIAEFYKNFGLFVGDNGDFSGGPWGDDLDAADFWLEPPLWIASGDIPEQAVTNLITRFRSGTDSPEIS